MLLAQMWAANRLIGPCDCYGYHLCINVSTTLSTTFKPPRILQEMWYLGESHRTL